MVGEATALVVGDGTAAVVGEATAPVVGDGTAAVVGEATAPVVGDGTAAVVGEATAPVVDVGTARGGGGGEWVPFAPAFNNAIGGGGDRRLTAGEVVAGVLMVATGAAGVAAGEADAGVIATAVAVDVDWRVMAGDGAAATGE